MSEIIGNVYPTKIPGYDEQADIQAALRLYHYGSVEYDIDNANTESLVQDSIAYHLNSLQTSIDTLDQREEQRGVGSSISNTRPTTVNDGYVWVDSTQGAGGFEGYPGAIYSNTTPTTTVDGALWVVRGSTPLTMKIYDSITSTWKTIGE